MVFNKPLRKPGNKSFVTIDCDQKAKSNQNLDYAELVSPAAVLDEKELCNSLGFFSTKAPRKKLNLKKVSADENLRNKRRRLENYFSTVELDSWSESQKAENWHDDLHYIVLKQQERSNFLHQLWLFLMLALFFIMLISIAGIIYSKKAEMKNAASHDQSDSIEFIQKFIEDFNHTETPPRQPDPANKYQLEDEVEEQEKDGWLERQAKYFGTILGARENEVLSLTKKMPSKKVRSVSPVDEKEFQSIDHSNLNQVDYELVADESSMSEKIEERFEDSMKTIAKKFDLPDVVKKVKDMF